MRKGRFLLDSTLFRKLFLLLIVTFYIPLVIVGYWTFSLSSGQIETMSASFLADNLSYNENRIQEIFEEVEQHSVQIYTSEKLQELLLSTKSGGVEDFEYIGEIGPILYELSNVNGYYVSVYPADAERFRNYDLLKANSPSADNGWMERALTYEGSGFWLNETRTVFSELRSDFYFIRPIRSLNLPFDVIGVMSIRVPSRQIADRILVLDRYPNHQVSLFDSQNNDLLHPDRAEADQVDWTEDILSSGRKEFRVVTGGDEAYYAASIGIGNNDWKMTATIPLSDVRGPIHQLRQSIWIIVAGSLLLIGVLLVFITNSFTVPIRVLVGHMKKLNLGILEYCQSFVTRRDEIGQLVAGYNGMIRGMQELLEQTKASEGMKRRLEIQMLMHQINPHLLYNTLDSIKWKAEVAGERSIAEMATLLANLLRFSLNDGDEITTVEREVEQVKCYLTIEQLRNNGGFHSMFHVQPDLWSLPYMKLSIQPIVENCVKHGMKKMERGQGKIMISMYSEDGDVYCRVEDNGPGCSDDELEALRRMDVDPSVRQLGGIGLSNVSKRLKAHFGPEYGLAFERNESGGLRVTIRQPIQ
ncbi:histidine kinase [Paenibacillus sp.]|uniref:sensor histidine kinase n=1 Tax=Paenibacillus sp. TaxID=58172 RepID=UPI0028121B78|nr:histidine kinase [Paenibacillus sp.]